LPLLEGLTFLFGTAIFISPNYQCGFINV